MTSDVEKKDIYIYHESLYRLRGRVVKGVGHLDHV